MPIAVIVMIALASFASCRSQQNAQDGIEIKADDNEPRKISYNIHPEIVGSAFQPEQQQLNFQITKAVMVNSDLLVSVKYGGGCKAHDFKLLYSQNADSDTLNFHLLHLTSDDRCKAYVFNDLQFDLSEIRLEGASIILINRQAVNRK